MIALSNENKIKGFGYPILLWLFMTESFFLMSLVYFEDYPLDKFSLIATMFNPVDLSRGAYFIEIGYFGIIGLYRCYISEILWNKPWLYIIFSNVTVLGDCTGFFDKLDCETKRFLIS